MWRPRWPNSKCEAGGAKVFRKQVEAGKPRAQVLGNQVLGKKFDELFKRAKENPDYAKPARDIDL
jgi:hypothetical protein